MSRTRDITEQRPCCERTHLAHRDVIDCIEGSGTNSVPDHGGTARDDSGWSDHLSGT